MAALSVEVSGLPRFLPAQTTESKLTSLTLRQASDLLRKQGVTSVALTQACLARIEKYQPGLPVGLQISGPHWAETRVLALAAAYEQATEWHTRRPALKAEEKP